MNPIHHYTTTKYWGQRDGAYHDVRLSKAEAAILSWFLQAPAAQRIKGFTYIESAGQYWVRFTADTRHGPGDPRSSIESFVDCGMDFAIVPDGYGDPLPGERGPRFITMMGWKVKTTQSLMKKLKSGQRGFVAKAGLPLIPHSDYVSERNRRERRL